MSRSNVSRTRAIALGAAAVLLLSSAGAVALRAANARKIEAKVNAAMERFHK